MKTVKGWFAEDTEDPDLSELGATKAEAEFKAAMRRGYAVARDAITDGWIRPAVRVELPLPVAKKLGLRRK